MATITGTPGNDNLNGLVDGVDPMTNDIIWGLAGNDTLQGNQGDDYVDGGEGNDVVGGGQGSDTVVGGSGNNSLRGGKGDDYIYGGDDFDGIRAGADNDFVAANGGDDVIRAGMGNDSIYGGAGNDTIDFADNGDTGPGVDTLYVNVRAGLDEGADKILNFVSGTDKIQLIDSDQTIGVAVKTLNDRAVTNAATVTTLVDNLLASRVNNPDGTFTYTYNNGTLTVNTQLQATDFVGYAPPATGQTFTLTQNVDTIPGLIGSLGTTNNAGDDIIIAGEGSLGGVHTLGSSDVINGGDGTDRMNLRLADTAAPVAGQAVTPNMTSVEQVYTQALTTAAGNAINAINTKGTTEWWSDRSTADLDINNVQELATLGVIGGVAGNDYTVGFANAVPTTELNVALQGAVLNNLGASRQGGGAEFSTWNINVGGTANSTIVALTDDNQVALTDMTKLTASGDRMLTITNELQGTTTISASAQTASTAGLRVVVDDTKDITFTGGAGTDRADVQALGLTQADKLDGGAGVDTFRIADGAMMTLANAQNVKNFEIFEGMGAAQVYDLDNLLPGNTLTEVRLNPTDTTNITVNNIPNSAVGTIRAVQDTIGIATLTAKSFIQGGTTDTATFVLDNSAEGAKFATGIDVTTLDFAKVDNLNIQSVSDGTAAAGEQNSINNLIAGDLESITVTGDQSVRIVTNAATNAVTKVDASGMTGNGAALEVDLSADIQGEGAEIIGTHRNDTITGTSVNVDGKGDNITAGAGSDVITLANTANAQRNTLNYTAAALASGDLVAGDADVVNNIAAGDVINMTSAVEAQLKANGVVLSATAANQVLGATFDINNNIRAIDDGANRRIQIDLNNDQLFTSANDFEIVLNNRAGTQVTYNAVNDRFEITAVVNPTIAFTAGQTKNGTAGQDDTFVGSIAGLNGTTLNGNAGDQDTLQLTTVGVIALNNGAAGGTLNDIENLQLANGANTITFGATGNFNASLSKITGGTGADDVDLDGLTDVAINVNLGDNADTLRLDALAYTGVLDGGADSDTLTTEGSGATVANVSGATVQNFEALVFTAATDQISVGANSLLDQFGTITGSGAGNDVINVIAGDHNVTGTNFVTFADAAADVVAISAGASFNFNGDAQLTAANVNFTGAGTLITQGNLTLAATDTIANVTFGQGGLLITDAGNTARTITDSAGDDRYNSTTATANTTVDLGNGGTDTVGVDAAGTATNLVTVNNFTEGLGGDQLSISFTAAAAGLVAAPTAANITANGAAAVANIVNVVSLGNPVSQVGGALTNLAAVQTAILNADLTATDTHFYYVAVDNGTDTGIYRFQFADAAGVATKIDDATDFTALTHIVTLTGVADVSTLDASQFVA